MYFKIGQVRSSINIDNHSKTWEIDVFNEQNEKETLLVKREIWELDIHFVEKLNKCKTITDIKTLHNRYYDKPA